jgi:hypothetical protein
MGDFDDLRRGNLAYRLIPVAIDLGNVRAGDSLVFIEGINKIIAVHTGTTPIIAQTTGQPTVVPLQLPESDPVDRPRPVVFWKKSKKKSRRGWTKIADINNDRVVEIFRAQGTLSARDVADALQLGSNASDGPRRSKVSRIITGLLHREVIVPTGEYSSGKRLYAINKSWSAESTG